MWRSAALVRIDVSEKVFLRSMLQLLVTATVILSSLIPYNLMIEAIRSSET
jgi:hypothetical protein